MPRDVNTEMVTEIVPVRAVDLSIGPFCTEFRCERFCDDDVFWDRGREIDRRVEKIDRRVREIDRQSLEKSSRREIGQEIGQNVFPHKLPCVGVLLDRIIVK